MSKMLPVSKIEANTGQYPGLPANPRLIRDDQFEKLKRSIEEFPEMLKLREIVVVPFGDGYVCIGGNMRLLACRELGFDKIPSKIVPFDFPVERLREFTIKDNVHFGESDIEKVQKFWMGHNPLEDWGYEVSEIETFKPNLDPETTVRQVTAEDIIKTREQLEENFKDPDKYKEVICPHCAKEFYLRDE